MDLEKVVSKIPLLNLFPTFANVWNELPQETKEEYAKILLSAAMKAAKSYAGGK